MRIIEGLTELEKAAKTKGYPGLPENPWVPWGTHRNPGRNLEHYPRSDGVPRAIWKLLRPLMSEKC